MRVERAQKQPVAQHREAAVGRHRAVRVELRQWSPVPPDRCPRACIQRGRVVARTRHEHQTVHHQRRHFHVAAAKLVRPLRGELRNIGGRDRLQPAVVRPLQVAPVVQPVARLGCGVLQAVPGDVEIVRRLPDGKIVFHARRLLQERHQIVHLLRLQRDLRHQRLHILPRPNLRLR